MHTLKTKRVNQKWKFFLSSFPLNTNIIRVNDLYNFRRYYFEPGQRCDANAGGFMPWKKIKKLKVHCTICSFSIIQLWTSHSSFKTLAADQHIIICWYFEKNQSVTIKLEFSRYPNVGVLAVFPSENIPAHNFFVWIAITAVFWTLGTLLWKSIDIRPFFNSTNTNFALKSLYGYAPLCEGWHAFKCCCGLHRRIPYPACIIWELQMVSFCQSIFQDLEKLPVLQTKDMLSPVIHLHVLDDK